MFDCLGRDWKEDADTSWNEDQWGFERRFDGDLPVEEGERREIQP